MFTSKTLDILYHGYQGSQLLQHDIDSLVDWSIPWQLKFNSKCKLLHLGQPYGYGEYLIDGNTISSNCINVVKVWLCG